MTFKKLPNRIDGQTPGVRHSIGKIICPRLNTNAGEDVEQAPGQPGRQGSLALGTHDRSLQAISGSAQHALIVLLD